MQRQKSAREFILELSDAIIAPHQYTRIATKIGPLRAE